MFRNKSILLLLPLFLILLSGCEEASGGGVLSSLLGALSGTGSSGGEYYGSSGVSDGTSESSSETIVTLVSSEDGGSDGNSSNTLVNPEPGSLLLFGTGLLSTALGRSRLRRLFKRKTS